jgi:methionyl-tRNA synthetase
LAPQDETVAKEAQAAIAEVLESYETLGFNHVLEKLWALIATADRYLTAEKPWSADVDQQRRAAVLWTTSELIRVVVALAHPILPDSTAKVWAVYGLPGRVSGQDLGTLTWGQLTPGTALGKSQPLFPRIDKKEAQERMEAMENEEQNAPSPAATTTPTTGLAPGASAAAAIAPAGTPGSATPAPAAASEKITIDDFTKVEMRVGQIKTAERIIGADKLLKLTVDIGTEIRQICAGIAQFYEPEKLIGRKVAVVVNLAPRKLRGVESNGMIVAASVGPEGRPVLAGFPDEDVEVGARLR